MKNCLVQYRGGGYKGCYWEWNFGVFDVNGAYHDIFSSGRSGCPTRRKIRRYIRKQEEGTDFYCYPLGSAEKLTDFASSSNPDYVKEVIKWFIVQEHIALNIRWEGFQAPCGSCGEVHHVLNLKPSNPQSQGGTVLKNTEFICHLCEAIAASTPAGFVH